MREVRRRFHEELRALEGEVQRTGTQARLLLERALQALAGGDPAVPASPCLECAVTVISATLPGLTEGRAWR